MRVFEIMTIDVGSCCLDDDLGCAASIMWEKDCGVVPIVDEERRVVGIVTDRDIAIAAASQNRRPAEIRARELSGRPVEICGMEEEVSDVLQRMVGARVRRLPVCGENGELLGIVSISDVLNKGDKRDAKRAVKALKKISGR